MSIITLNAGHKYKFTSSGSNLAFKEGTDNPLGLTVASGGLQAHGNLEIISGSAIFDGPISASNAVRFTGLGGTYPSTGNVKTVYVQDDGTLQLGVIGAGTVDSSSGNIFTSDGNLVSSREIGLVNSNLSFMPGAFSTGTPVLFIGGSATYENKIGINTSTPTDALHVVGTISASTDIYAGGDIFCEGIITADEFHTTTISTSVQYSTGNTEFGDESTDIHKFTGSLEISGNLIVTDDDSLFYGMVSMSVLSSSLGIAAGGGITAHGDISSSVDSTGSFGAGEFFGRVQMADKLYIGDSNTSGSHTLQISESGASALINIGTDDFTKRAGIYFTAMREAHGTVASSQLFKSGSQTYFLHDESYISRHNGKTAFKIDGGGDIYFVSGSSNGTIETTYLFGDASTQRIGIGTTTPPKKLTVAGDISASGHIHSVGSYHIEIDGTDGSGPRIHMGDIADSDNFMTIGAFASINQIDTKTRDFHLYGTNTTTGFYFDESAGNFGIGTTAPISTLDIKTNANVSGSRISFDSSGSYRPTITMYKWMGGDANHHAWNQNIASDGNLNFGYYGTGTNGAKFDGGTEDFDNKLVLDINGNVGIGIDTPGEKLVVAGNISASGTGSFTGGGLFEGYVGIGTTSPGATLHVEALNDLNTVAWFKSSDDKALIVIEDVDTAFSLIAKDAKFHIGTGSTDYENFTVWPSQKRVGINTTAPNEALEVIGDISASGDLHGSDLHLSSIDQTSQAWYSLPNNEVQWDRTEAANGSDEYVKIMTLNGSTKKIRLIVIATGNNTQAREEFLIAHSGYSMKTNIMQLPSTRYNTSKVLGVYTNSPSGSNQEVYIKVAGIDSTSVNSGYVKIISNQPIHTAAEIQASTAPTFIPETTGGYSAIELSNNTHNNTSLQLSRGINAQGTSSMADLHVTENLGVGTTSPESLLHIKATGASSIATIGTDDSANDAYLRFVRDGQNGWAVGRDNDDATFRIAYASNDTPAVGTGDYLTISNTGNVGIGTTDPQATLHVAGIISTSNDIVIESSDPTIHFKDTDSAAYLGSVGASNEILYVRGSAAGQDVEIRSTNFDNAIFVDDSTQRIGIGLNNPTHTLSILGDISASGTIFAARFESSGSSDTIEVIDNMVITGSLTANSVTASVDGLLVSGTLSIINETGPTAYIKTKVGSFDEYHLRNDNDAFQIYNATDDRKELVVDGAGGIGIGVATPHVNGFALQVSGAIGPFGDDEHALGTKQIRFSDVFAVQTTVGAIFETGLATKDIGKLETGTVVVWKNGKLTESYKEDDNMVMGIIKQGKDEPIILGAEPILVTGEVREGDFLITSDTPGHAKAQPDEYLLRTGTIIAQALESTDGESNLIKGMIRKL